MGYTTCFMERGNDPYKKKIGEDVTKITTVGAHTHKHQSTVERF